MRSRKLLFWSCLYWLLIVSLLVYHFEGASQLSESGNRERAESVSRDPISAIISERAASGSPRPRSSSNATRVSGLDSLPERIGIEEGFLEFFNLEAASAVVFGNGMDGRGVSASMRDALQISEIEMASLGEILREGMKRLQELQYGARTENRLSENVSWILVAPFHDSGLALKVQLTEQITGVVGQHRGRFFSSFLDSNFNDFGAHPFAMRAQFDSGSDMVEFYTFPGLDYVPAEFTRLKATAGATNTKAFEIMFGKIFAP